MECKIGDIRVYYEIYGEGIPVLMIHGWSVDHRLMKGCMEPVFKIQNDGWKRIYLDLPGMGNTKGADWLTSSDQMLEILLGFIDTVIPNEHFVLAGESYGGHLVRAIIHERPTMVDGLLLICPSVGRSRAQYMVLEKDEELLRSLTEEEKQDFQAEGINVIQNKRVWERYKEEIVPAFKMADYQFLNHLSGEISFEVDSLKEPFQKPTLMLAGRQDSRVGYQDLWNILDLYPRASLCILDKAGHDLQIEQAAIFTAAVKEWLDRVRAELSEPDTQNIYIVL